MQFSNYGNDGIAKLWGEISQGGRLEAGIYSADANKNFTLVVGHAGGVKLYSYNAPIRKRVRSHSEDYPFEYWINDASYSVTTARHQSLARRHEYNNPKACTFDFTVFGEVFKLQSTGLTRDVFVYPAGIRAKELVDGFANFISKPRRQKRTIAREAVERAQGLRELCHIIEYSCKTENDINMYHMMEDYASAFEQCAEFGGVKEIFEAVHALNKG